jgi:hypothetical protein
MKSFKQYLREFAVQSTSDYVFDTPSGEAGSLKIPISGPMFKRIWPDTIRSTVFHATDHAGLAKLKKLEGGKKSISAFFSMMSRYMESGIATTGGVVAEMDADVLISASSDIMSEVDKTGRRWVEMSWFENAQRYGVGADFRKVEKDLTILIIGLVKKYIPKDKEIQQTKHFAKDAGAAFQIWSNFKHHLKGDGKILRLVIKDYFDGVEKIIKRHQKIMGSIFYSYARSKRQTEESWDEQIVNNIKVKTIHLIQPTQLKIDTADPDRTHPIDSYEFAKEKAEKLFGTVKEWNSSIDLEIYTREVVKKGIGKKEKK